MPRPEKYEKFEATVIGATEKALRIDTGNGRYWVPRAVIRNGDEVVDSFAAHVELEIQSWFVEKEEID